MIKTWLFFFLLIFMIMMIPWRDEVIQTVNNDDKDDYINHKVANHNSNDSFCFKLHLNSCFIIIIIYSCLNCQFRVENLWLFDLMNKIFFMNYHHHRHDMVHNVIHVTLHAYTYINVKKFLQIFFHLSFLFSRLNAENRWWKDEDSVFIHSLW